MRSYLKQHLFDGERLRRRTLQEFATAVRSGRLIAFVGAFATRDAGYDEWSDFLTAYANLALHFVGKFAAETTTDPQAMTRAEQAKRAIESLVETMPKSGVTDSEKRWDNALTSLSVIAQAISYLEMPDELKRRFEEAVGDKFRLTEHVSARSNAQRIADLGIGRVITLNYDLEFEWLWMTTAGEKHEGGSGRHEVFQGLLKDRSSITTVDPNSRVRILPSGRSVISDVFSRERTDRLIEFAVGSPDYEAHILHLHGLAISPETMVISQWDYNRQYRRSGVSKLPFEHALRVLFAGNPILFIGVGMSERDVTATLEQIVSDHPDRRVAPAFLLWNAPSCRHARESDRFRWLHRFDVLTIFDDEILPPDQQQPADPATLGSDEIRLALSLDNLAETAARIVTPFEWRSGDFRSIRPKLDCEKNEELGRYDIYTSETPHAGHSPANMIDDSHHIVLFIDRPGKGKGFLAQEYRNQWHAAQQDGVKARSMLINASFVFEIESVFTLISGLADKTLASEAKQSRRMALRTYFEGKVENPPRLLIMINGMERFFTPDGQPLSTELDELLRSVIRLHNQTVSAASAQQLPDTAIAGTQAEAAAANCVTSPISANGIAQESREDSPATPIPSFQIVAFGTKRVLKYFNSLEIIARTHLVEEAKLPPVATKSLPSTYFDTLAASFTARGFTPNTTQELAIRRKCKGDAAELRRHFFAAYLQTETLKAMGVEDADLCFDIITAMAHIGQPVEDAILFHVPRIHRRIGHLGKRLAARKLIDALKTLSDIHLILPRARFEAFPSLWKRYGLHRSVLTEMRDRVGVPLSDSKLSTGFNLSLFIAQPVDGYSPEAEIHDELDTLIDWLVGSYRDNPLDMFRGDSQSPATADALQQEDAQVDEMTGRSRAHASACLRAALAIVRNYYSTSALLTLDVTGSGDRSEKDGPLARHAERLDRLIMAADCNAIARRLAVQSGAIETGPAGIGPAPFYPDDLIWLYNERGVVKLTQGDLYEARHSFDQAIRVNEEFVEFDDRSHNWRHLMLNQLHVDIERARLERAEQRISEIEQSIEDSIGQPYENLREHIVQKYGLRISSKQHVVDPSYEHDILLSVGLMFGYRGLCLHLRGELKPADEMFQVAVNILENIGEQRAYAMFQRHFSSLKSALGDSDKAMEALRLAIASAEATRQTDIAHYGRIAAAWHTQFAGADPAKRSTLIRRLQRALDYAEAGEMHRVRVEAGLNLARVKFESGDFDSALERIADAMATAARNGMSLRKISLRILMGQILMRRGDHKTGSSLIERAIKNADRVGYQGAVGLAQRVIALEEEPSIGKFRS